MEYAALWPSPTDGVAVPVTIYVPSQQANDFVELPGQSLMWQGIVSTTHITLKTIQ